MKRTFALFLTGCILAMSLAACAPKTEGATAQKETTGEPSFEESTKINLSEIEYTDEQLEFVNEFNQMLTDYNTAVDAFNASALTENQETAATIHELSKALDNAMIDLSDPSTLTAEKMDSYRLVIGNTYSFINTIYASLNDLPAVEETETVDDYTTEQLEFMNEFGALIEDYNSLIELLVTSKLANDPLFSEAIKTVSTKIDAIREQCYDVTVLSKEDMEHYRTSFSDIYVLLDEIREILKVDYQIYS